MGATTLIRNGWSDRRRAERLGRLLCIVAALAGCKGKPEQPPQAGGKPIGHWLDAMHDPNVKARAEAALKLGNVGAADPRALPALIEGLADPESPVRHAAMDGIVKLGAGAKDAVPALQKIRDSDVDPKLRDLAGRMLQHIADAMAKANAPPSEGNQK
jgi:HEAT repeat protein